MIAEDYRTLVIRAREMPLGEKLSLGPRLFDRACEDIAARLRAHFPDMNDEQVRTTLGQIVACWWR